MPRPRTRSVLSDARGLLSKRIFRGRVWGVWLQAGVLVGGCSVSGLEGGFDEGTSDEELGATGDQRGDAGADRHGDHDFDGGRWWHGRGDAAAQDARVLLDARLNHDATAHHGADDAGALQCNGDGFPVFAANLRPLQGYDYIAVREASELSPAPELQEETWASAAYRTLSEIGVRCARATGSACADKVRYHPHSLANSTCTDRCIERAIVTTQGDEVRRWSTSAELTTFLGPIDSPDEALMLVSAAGFSLTCGDAALSAVREVGEGYEVLATRHITLCPLHSERVRLQVSYTGQLSMREATRLPSSGDACIGGAATSQVGEGGAVR